MKKSLLMVAIASLAIISCTKSENNADTSSATTTESTSGGQEAVVDEDSAPTIVKLAVGNKDLSTLVTAVQAAELTTSLSNAGPFTVFAPTNNAFRAAGFPTIASIQSADAATLTNILTYHVIAARVFSSDLVNGAMPTTVNGGKVTIGLTSGATVKGNSNAFPSNILATNILVTNGVVHVIDRVLLP